ncbi:MAG: TolB family protein [Gemmatimonas sp.]
MHRPLTSALVGAMLLAVACDENTPINPPVEDAGITIVSGESASDTIDALITQSLIVEVRDAQGLAPRGTNVRFEVQPPSDPSRRSETAIQVCAITTSCAPQGTSTFAADTVDSQGRTAVVLRMGRVAGTAVVRITVPELGLADSVSFEVKSGKAFRILPARSTIAVDIGSTASLGPSIVDRYGNIAPGPLTYTLGAGNSVSVNASSGIVNGLEFGVQSVYVQQGTFSDSVSVRVLPAGRLVAWVNTSRHIRMIDINGNNSRIMATDVSSDFGAFPRFSPNRQRISFHVGAHPNGGPPSIVGLVDTVGTRANVGLGSVLTNILTSRPMADGSTLLVASRLPDYSMWLWRVDQNGTSTPVIALPQFPLAYGAADISPDGARVAYVAATQLRILTVQTGDVVSVNEPLVQSPRWSPQGDRIALLGGASFNGSPIIFNADGSGRRTVGTLSFSPGLSWSPDGLYLIGRSAANPSGALRIVRVSDARSVVLSFADPAGGLTDYYQPDWR